MPRLIKKKAKAPHVPSQALRRKKKPTFSYSTKGILKTCGLGAFSLFIIWVCLSKTPGELVDQGLERFYTFTKNHGLRVKKITLDGHYYTQKADILSVSAVTLGTPILKQSPSDIKKRVETLPWVRSAKVQRILPATFHIKVAEKLPIALYQKNKKLTLVDDQGKLIQGARIQKFSYLPIVIGDGAPERTPALFADLTSQPYLQKKLSSAILVSKRRWDLVLNSKVKIQLPETDIKKSLQHLSVIEKDKNLSMGDIRTIDLRIPDRSYIRLKDKVAASRRTSKKRRHV